MKWHKDKTIPKDLWFLLITSIGFFFLRFPSLFEPYWYGDEGIYQVIGMAIRQGELLYRDIFDNKPPLLYIIYSIFNGDQFGVRLFSLVVGLLTVIVFFWVAKELFSSEKKEHRAIVYGTTGLFALFFAIPYIEGNIANAENFMLLPTLLAAYILLKVPEKKPFWYLCISGFFLSISFLLKIVAIFDLAAFSLFFFMTQAPIQHLWHRYRVMQAVAIAGFKTLPLIAGFLPLLIATASYFAFHNALPIFIHSIFFQNVEYVNYGNTFIIPQGLLILKLVLLALVVGLLFLKRQKLTKPSLFIFLWLACSLFSTFFSHRPYTHYVLLVLPSFILCLGLMLGKEERVSRLALLASVITFVLLAANFSYYKKTPAYYGNFIQYFVGTISTREYLAFYDRNTPIDYEVAAYINARAASHDQLFLWGDNAMLYKMTNKLPPGRFIVAYHVASCDAVGQTGDAFIKQSPKYVVVMPNVAPFPYPLYNYTLTLYINKVALYERTF